MVLIGGFHRLNPLDRDDIFHTFQLTFKLRNISSLLQRVNAVTPFNEELQMLFNFIFHLPYDHVPYLPRVVGHLWLELTSILVNSSDGRRVKLQLKVIGEEFQFLTYLSGPLGSLRESLQLFHLLIKVYSKLLNLLRIARLKQ